MTGVSLIIGLVMSAVVAFVLILAIVKVVKIRKKSMGEIAIKKMSYFNAVAGNCDHAADEKTDSVSYAGCDFIDKDGHKIDAGSFDIYIAVGDSMRLCGINDGDMLFVDRNYKDSLSSLPKVLVMNISNAKENEVKYKVRRAWKVCSINDDLDNLIGEIQNSVKFAVLKNSEYYSDDNSMIEDFHIELDKYRKEFLTGRQDNDYSEIVISTTIREEKIHFSIHPLQLVAGVVRHSFDTTRR